MEFLGKKVENFNVNDTRRIGITEGRTGKSSEYTAIITSKSVSIEKNGIFIGYEPCKGEFISFFISDRSVFRTSSEVNGTVEGIKSSRLDMDKVFLDHNSSEDGNDLLVFIFTTKAMQVPDSVTHGSFISKDKNNGKFSSTFILYYKAQN